MNKVNKQKIKYKKKIFRFCVVKWRQSRNKQPKRIEIVTVHHRLG